MEINCNLAACLMRTYFNMNVTTSIRDAILTHLIKCEHCRKKYEEYAKAIGCKFELMEDIKKTYDEYDKTDEVDKTSMDEKPVVKKRTYYEIAKDKDISSLMNIQSVRERFKERYETDDAEYLKKLQDFGWYLAEEACKRIDTLENLFELSGEVKDK